MAEMWTGVYRPLRVVAHLASPLACVPGEPLLPLDGLLEFAAFKLGWPPVLQYTDGNGRHHLPRLDSSCPANFVLPVKRIGHKCDPDWFWSASQAEFPAGFELDRTHWNKRFDGLDPNLERHLDFGGKRGRVGIAAGRYKSYHMPLCLIVAPRLEWHCLGAVDGVTRLLREVTHLGHKRSQGHGEVIRWEVYAEREDRSIWRADGQPARSLPLGWLERQGYELGVWERATVSIRPPSWHPSRRRDCAVPPQPIPGMAKAVAK